VNYLFKELILTSIYFQLALVENPVPVDQANPVKDNQ